MSVHGLKLTIIMDAFTLNYDLCQLVKNMKACIIGAWGRPGFYFPALSGS